MIRKVAERRRQKESTLLHSAKYSRETSKRLGVGTPALRARRTNLFAHPRPIQFEVCVREGEGCGVDRNHYNLLYVVDHQATVTETTLNFPRKSFTFLASLTLHYGTSTSE